ncbi:hypothetical protein DXG03_005304 [Asterophora parasitica]|uniref:Uncharacterized protein n=1 Tax=Asterophora parasitica TaxID=117018 RepID=A0A9P7G803_9AGAR|nr:hypothetical protein DXG03_005304 [Asterophora parasitica]
MSTNDIPSWAALQTATTSEDSESEVDQLSSEPNLDTITTSRQLPKSRRKRLRDDGENSKNGNKITAFSGVGTNLDITARDIPRASSAAPSIVSEASRTTDTTQQILYSHSTPPTSTASYTRPESQPAGSHFLGVLITTLPSGRPSTKSGLIAPSSGSAAPYASNHDTNAHESILPVPSLALHPEESQDDASTRVHESLPIPDSSLPGPGTLLAAEPPSRPSILQIWALLNRVSSVSHATTLKSTPTAESNANDIGPVLWPTNERSRAQLGNIEEILPDALGSVFDQKVPAERVALIIGPSRPALARPKMRDAGSSSRPAAGQRRSYARQAKDATHNVPRDLYEDEIEDLFGADFGRVNMKSAGVTTVGHDAMSVHTRHLLASRTVMKGAGGHLNVNEGATRPVGIPSHSRAERFVEVLDETFGPGCEYCGDGRKPKKGQVRKAATMDSNTTSKTSREASISSEDEENVGSQFVRLKRPLDDGATALANKRPRTDKFGDDDLVGQSAAEEWVAAMQRLIKGKVTLSKESLRLMDNLLGAIDVLKGGLGADILEV